MAQDARQGAGGRRTPRIIRRWPVGGFQQFCVVMEQLKDAPAHVHCIANYRVSAFFHRYRRDVLGMDETQVRAEMEAVWHPEEQATSSQSNEIGMREDFGVIEN